MHNRRSGYEEAVDREDENGMDIVVESLEARRLLESVMGTMEARLCLSELRKRHRDDRDRPPILSPRLPELWLFVIVGMRSSGHDLLWISCRLSGLDSNMPQTLLRVDPFQLLDPTLRDILHCITLAGFDRMVTRN